MYMAFLLQTNYDTQGWLEEDPQVKGLLSN